MNNIILNIERNGYEITIDRCDEYIRVNCNGSTHAKFNEFAMGELPALEEAVNFAKKLETNALKSFVETD